MEQLIATLQLHACQCSKNMTQACSQRTPESLLPEHRVLDTKKQPVLIQLTQQLLFL